MSKLQQLRAAWNGDIDRLQSTVDELTQTQTEMRTAYSDAITSAILRDAQNANAYSGAIEIAAGMMARGFAAAEPIGRDASRFDAIVLSQMGRDIVEYGESAWLIRTPLEKMWAFTILDDGSYQYKTVEDNLAVSSDVLHWRYTLDGLSQRGVSPLGKAKTLRQLNERLEASMASEADAVVGYVLPIPADPNDSTIDNLKSDIASMDGNIAFVETTRGGYDQGGSTAPRKDYEPQRLGARIPDTTVQAYEYTLQAVAAACGIPIQLLMNVDGAAQREAWRRFLHGSIMPLAKTLSAQARRAGLDVQFSFNALMASDIAGRARAFGSLRTAEMSIEEAKRHTGLD